jgi:hypothetical protein
MHFLTLLAAIACMAVVDGAVLRNATSLGGVPTIDFSCSKPGDLLSGQKVTLSPDTIKGNEHVNVTAIGHLASDVNGGSVHVAVALDGIPLLSLQLDLCKTLAKVGQSCPLKAGDSKVTMGVQIPEIPVAGTVKADVTVTTNDAPPKEVTCVTMSCKIP